MKKMLILLILMHAFILVTSAQHTYLLLTRKHTVAYSSTEPVDVLNNILIEILASLLPLQFQPYIIQNINSLINSF